MQHLDRIKINHVKDKYLDDGLLPSIDTAYASCKLNETSEKRVRKRNHNLSQSISYAPNSTLENPSMSIFETGLKLNSNHDLKNVITQVELNSSREKCERYNTKPSARSRIVITKSQEPMMNFVDSKIQGDNSIVGNSIIEESEMTSPKIN